MLFIVSNMLQQTSSFGFKFLFKWSFLFFWILLLLINAIIISLQAGTIEVGLKDIGNRLLLPTIQLGEDSREIVKSGGIIIEDSFWKTFQNYLSLILNLYTICMWIYVFTWIWGKTPFTNGLSFTNLFLGFLTFLVIMLLFNAYYGKYAFIEPIKAIFWDFPRILPYIVSKTKETIDPLYNNITNVI